LEIHSGEFGREGVGGMPAKKKKKKAAEGSQLAIPSSFDSAKKKAKSAAQDACNVYIYI
jgi:hypothetical protein